MRIDLEAVMVRVVEALQGNDRCSSVRGELTGERRANRPQIRVFFTADGIDRVFLYHIQREGPVHTVARSLVDDTLRTLPQIVREGIGGHVQPNDVYYPTALGLTPTTIPGQASGSSPYSG